MGHEQYSLVFKGVFNPIAGLLWSESMDELVYVLQFTLGQVSLHTEKIQANQMHHIVYSNYTTQVARMP